jgi:hypothetical protein
MSKIPQGEWNAIAARYQNGESISKIARTYGCTPPAIHYILKRNRLRPAEAAAQPPQTRPAEAVQTRLVRANPPDAAPVPYAEKFNNGAADPSLVRASAPPGPSPKMPSDARPAQAETAPPSPFPNIPNPAGNQVHRPATPAAGLPGLDSKLHLRAEAAIELFRSSFDAALSEGSPGVRERLRQAATDLMRVAARTTIVLDRLDAVAERSGRVHNYPRSAHAGDEVGKLGSG